MRTSKWAAAALLLIFLAGGGWYYYANRQTEEPRRYKTAQAARGAVTVEVSATGALSAVNSVDVSSKVTGLIKEMLAAENDRVKAGQTLVVLDDSTVKSQLLQMEAKVITAKADYERARRLQAAGAFSRQQLDAAWLDYQVAKTNYDSTASTLADYIIKSPIDGIVIGKPLAAGQTVAQGISAPMVIMTVADLSKMQIETQVDETDIGKVKLGRRVTFTVDTYADKTFTGVVSKISNKSITTNNVVYYTVYVKVNRTDFDLKPGMTARVAILADERLNVLRVPKQAVKDKDGRATVEVIPAGGAKPREAEVKTGLTGDDDVEIVSGLKEGDTVVLGQKKSPAGPPRML